jgi:hypothetical protein
LSESRPPEFQPVVDPAEAKSILREAVKVTASTTIWSRSQKHMIKSHLSMYSAAEDVLYFAIPTNEDIREFVRDLHGGGNEECLFSISLPHANIFFKSDFIAVDAPGLKFKVPARIFKVQRRAEMRFTIPLDYKIRVEFSDPLFPEKVLIKEIIDISATGLAFLASVNEQPMFVKGSRLRDLKFKIRGREIRVDAEVRHAVSLSSRGAKNSGFKIGISFIGIRPGESQHIAVFVFDECRRLYFRLM